MHHYQYLYVPFKHRVIRDRKISYSIITFTMMIPSDATNLLLSNDKSVLTRNQHLVYHSQD